jgi:hypothetical protein
MIVSYLPDDFDPSTVPETVFEEINTLNPEMIATGLW